MSTTEPNLDFLSRRLIQAAKGDLGAYLGSAALEQELVGALYSLVRDVLRQWHPPATLGAQEKGKLVDELALAIYLTAAAWQSADAHTLELLPSLRRTLAIALGAPDGHPAGDPAEAVEEGPVRS